MSALPDTKLLILEKQGATREASYKAIASGLSATKMTVDKFGDEHFEEDHASRLRAAELISKLNGDLKTETVVDNRQVHINISPKDVIALTEMVKQVRGEILSLRTDGRQTGEIIDITP